MSMKDGIAIADSLEGGDVFGVRIYDALTGKNPVHTSTSARESQTKQQAYSIVSSGDRCSEPCSEVDDNFAATFTVRSYDEQNGKLGWSYHFY